MEAPDMPDPEDAPSAADLVPAEAEGAATRRAGAGTEQDTARPAVEAPVPTHGELASEEQLDEGERAVELAGGGGVDAGPPPDDDVDEPERTARAIEAAGGAVERG
jgi:hypothetical protein